MRGSGMGRKLYGSLEKRLKDMGILNLYACIAYTETEDEYLTKMIWMEKVIGEHKQVQPPVKNDQR